MSFFCLLVSKHVVIVHWNIFMFSFKNPYQVFLYVSCWHCILLMVFSISFEVFLGLVWWMMVDWNFNILTIMLQDPLIYLKLMVQQVSSDLLWREGMTTSLLPVWWKSRSSAQTLLTTGWSSPWYCWVGVRVQVTRSELITFWLWEVGHCFMAFCEVSLHCGWWPLLLDGGEHPDFLLGPLWYTPL